MFKQDIHIRNFEDFSRDVELLKPLRPSEVYLCLIRKGHIRYLINKELQEVEENCIIFISSRNLYTLVENSDDLEVYYMNLTSSYRSYTPLKFNRFDVYRTISENYSSIICLPEIDFDYIWKIVDFMHYHLYKKKSKTFLKELIENAFSALAYSIVGHLEKKVVETPANNSRSEEKVLEFLELLGQNFIKQRDLQFYADKLHITPKYLSKIIKQITGNPPTYFLTQLLVDASCHALSQKDLTIYQVSDMLGFSDYFTFSKFFKRNMDMTPTEFRNNL